MEGKDISEIKSVLKMQKSPVHAKVDILSALKKRIYEQKITRVVAGCFGLLVVAGTLVGFLIRRTDGA
jgi:hypothetical protein